uniref:C2H2-type domain-containing protein n=1 Tax=Ceratitis capitata TaxID=7213 RepID=W8AYR0_CERCA
MDASKQTFSEANNTGASMYLSFDSTISSLAYKTLEATIDDLSMLSNMDNEEETVENSLDTHQNSTLEAIDSHLNYLDSVKGKDTQLQQSSMPKRILKEFNVVSSTPSKEQILRSVEVARGSSAERCIAFIELNEEKETDETTKNKENAVPAKEVVGNSQANIENEPMTTTDKSKSTANEEVGINKTEDVNKTTKANTEKTLNSQSGQNEENTLENKAINKRSSILKKPICEPDLLTNRPSRIAVNSNKRFSVNNFNVKTDIDKQITEIPKLMTKVLKIAEASTANKDKTTTSSTLDKRKSIMYNMKGRSSMLPSNTAIQAEKRPFAYTQRMSVLVKTTLNSPARKIARRSVFPASQLTHNLPLKPSRISMLPTSRGAPTTIATKYTNGAIKSITESTKQTLTNRKSIYPVEKLPKTTTTTTVVKAQNIFKPRQSTTAKPESSFTCNTCGCKFSIKSLLDAHKRSHEGDGLPAFVKKPTINALSTAPPVTQSNVANKCKYCDKKFALVRALHIHLLQNCPKIPPIEKRKLKFDEMDHVEKAQLPGFFHASTSNNNKVNNKTETLVQTKSVTKAQRSRSDLSSISLSSTDSANDKKALAEITMIAKNAAAVADGILPDMAPPSGRAIKKTAAHAGIHRTPNKSITCHTCKISFKCIMDHIHHNMVVHFKNLEVQNTNDNAQKTTK